MEREKVSNQEDSSECVHGLKRNRPAPERAGHPVQSFYPKKELARIETLVRNQTRKKRIEAVVLGTLGGLGLLAVAVAAPNMAQLLKHVLPRTRLATHQHSVGRTISRLIKEGAIRKQNGKYVLSKMGARRLQVLVVHGAVASKAASRKQRWDKKWRIVLFDVKESRRQVRDSLRDLLVETGFVQLQKSAWVYPFPCDEVVALLKFHLRLGWDLLYIIADEVEGDDRLRAHFGLPNHHL